MNNNIAEVAGGLSKKKFNFGIKFWQKLILTLLNKICIEKKLYFHCQTDLVKMFYIAIVQDSLEFRTKMPEITKRGELENILYYSNIRRLV